MKILKFVKIFFPLLFFAQSSYNEYVDYLKNLVKYLSSPTFSGRFVHDSGIWKAEKFIFEELSKLNFSCTLLSFSTKVNLIEDARVSVDGIFLTPGIEYRPAPFIRSIDTVITFSKDASDKSICMQLKYGPVYDTAKGLIIKYEEKIRQYKFSKNFNEIVFTSDSSINLIHSLSTKQEKLWGIVIRRECPYILEISVKAHEREFYFNNIIALWKTPQKSNKNLIFVTHYDHLGKIGESIYPGASDNASGVAMLLALAKYVSIVRPPVNVIFLFTAAEELGLLGSFSVLNYFLSYYPPKNSIVINLDIVGGGDNGIVIVGAYENKKIFKLLKKTNTKHKIHLNITPRKITQNSDHFPFYLKGYKAIFIYTSGGAQCYHNPCDTYETLSFSASGKLFELLVKTFLEIK